jgi:hypothetical protein
VTEDWVTARPSGRVPAAGARRRPGRPDLVDLDQVEAEHLELRQHAVQRRPIQEAGERALACRAGRELSYAWKRLISGHLGRLATREDVALHRRYIAGTSCRTSGAHREVAGHSTGVSLQGPRAGGCATMSR